LRTGRARLALDRRTRREDAPNRRRELARDLGDARPIAGVILTVGMGVDSNVLIFERIREELRNGKTPPSAVEQGFAHAWITIVDTHVTTIVSAAILFLFGTGPVKGFAVTLTFGLLANLFTAVFVSRMIFDWILSRKQRGEALSI